ncbi:hypothetical protein KPH14_010335 [Odynerus spinipes]|uniref:Uncharacterized protein n=1 Tax=Odynerus spinipes TaxID=1348599 RepID=A0AAD9VTP7_9HYME|nr:hypothetical protein KPH14_010335 [Odynerus spinipes]
MHAIMKCTLTFLAALFLVGVSAHPLNGFSSIELQHDILDFYVILPVSEFQQVAHKHITSDPKFIEAINYMSTEEFHNLVYAVEALPEFQEYVRYNEEAGYPMYEELRWVHIYFEMKPYVPPKESHQQLTREADEGGMAGFVQDVIAILPKKELKELHDKKLKESAAFAKYSSYILSEKYTELQNAITSQKAYIEFKEKSLAHGVDIAAIEDMKLHLLGFK